jgi:hypothetical protein
MRGSQARSLRFIVEIKNARILDCYINFDGPSGTLLGEFPLVDADGVLALTV